MDLITCLNSRKKRRSDSRTVIVYLPLKNTVGEFSRNSRRTTNKKRRRRKIRRKGDRNKSSHSGSNVLDPILVMDSITLHQSTFDTETLEVAVENVRYPLTNESEYIRYLYEEKTKPVLLRPTENVG